ncbi:MAG: fibronectin type III domain-containing protein [Flavobacteriales bacterium]
MANIALKLYDLTAAALVYLIREVVLRMTNNANFLTPRVPLADMTLMGDQLEVAIQAAIDGNRFQRNTRDNLVLEARAMLKLQADYVRSMCGGDFTKLLSSGYPMAVPPAPIVQVEIPVMRFARAAADVTGVMDVQWKTVRGAHGYEVLMSEKDPGVAANWENIGFTTKVRHSASGLESGKKYWFAVRAVGSNSISAMSQEVFGRAA